MTSRGVDINGATVVITGASSGIGRATALGFAERGANVVLAARGADSLAKAAAGCRDRGGRTLDVVTDVADGPQVEELARRAVAEFGRIDVWVNNAAVMAYAGIGEAPVDVIRQVLDVNLVGQMNGAHAALPYMHEQGTGVIINVASLYAKMTSPYVDAYVTSKYGVLGFSEVLRQELKPDRGIHVATILPGSIDTPIFASAANYTGHRVKPPPPVSSPERVVRAIVRAAQRPRAEVVVGRLQQVLSWVHTVVPRLYEEIAPYAIRMFVLDRERVSHSDGNVFEPNAGSNPVRGGWRKDRIRAGVAAGAVAAAGTGVLAARRLRKRLASPESPTASAQPGGG